MYAPSSAGTYLDDKTQDISVDRGRQLRAARHAAVRIGCASPVPRASTTTASTRRSSARRPRCSTRSRDNHNVRVGYNRAFKSPTVLENFLRINDTLLGNRTGFVMRDGDGQRDQRDRAARARAGRRARGRLQGRDRQQALHRRGRVPVVVPQLHQPADAGREPDGGDADVRVVRRRHADARRARRPKARCRRT